MKKLSKGFAILSIAVVVMSCVKNTHSFRFSYAPRVETASQPVEVAKTNTVVASTSKEASVIAEKPAAVEVAKQFKATRSVAPENTPKEKPSFKERLVKKIVAKKIQKMEKLSGMSNNMKLGIVIASISLLVLIFVAASVITGSIGGVLGLLGGLGLLAGLIIILLDVMEII